MRPRLQARHWTIVERKTDMMGDIGGHQASIDHAFASWERLRRRAYESERAWASAVTVTADRQRLQALRRDLALHSDEADRALHRAMGMLQTAGASSAGLHPGPR